MVKNFHIKKKKLNTRETDSERRKRLAISRGPAPVLSPTVSELDAALYTFDEHVRASANHLKRIAALRSIELTEEHCGDIIAAALKKKPLLWTTCGANRASQIVLENILENADPRSLINPEFADIRSALPDEEAQALWRDCDREVIRRLWRDNRLPKSYKPKHYKAPTGANVQPERTTQ